MKLKPNAYKAYERKQVLMLATLNQAGKNIFRREQKFCYSPLLATHPDGLRRGFELDCENLPRRNST